MDLHFLAGRDRVVEADALDIATVARIALISHDDVVEGTLLRAATGKANLDHVISLIFQGFPARTPECNRVGPSEPRILADLGENESPNKQLRLLS